MQTTVTKKQIFQAFYSGLICICLLWLWDSLLWNHGALNTSIARIIGLSVSFIIWVVGAAFIIPKLGLKKQKTIKNKTALAIYWGFIIVCAVWLLEALLSKDKIINTSAVMLAVLAVIYIIWVVAYLFLFTKKRNSK